MTDPIADADDASTDLVRLYEALGVPLLDAELKIQLLRAEFGR